MQVGDLVRWKNSVGIIVEVGKFTGGGDILVQWMDPALGPDPLVAKSELLEVV